MKNKKQLIKRLSMSASLVIVVAMLLSACSLFSPAAPTPDLQAQQATVDAAALQTLQARRAIQTSTAAALPTSTFTLAPTLAPTLEPTATFTPAATATLPPPPTQTFQPYTPAPKQTATPSLYGCKLTGVSPANGAKFKLEEDFDVTWTVTNAGTKSWETGLIDLKYISGQKMQTKGRVFDVNTVVAVGDDITLVVDMKAPSVAGKYAASWALTMDGAPFCELPVSIEAVNP